MHSNVTAAPFFSLPPNCYFSKNYCGWLRACYAAPRCGRPISDTFYFCSEKYINECFRHLATTVELRNREPGRPTSVALRLRRPICISTQLRWMKLFSVISQFTQLSLEPLRRPFWPYNDLYQLPTLTAHDCRCHAGIDWLTSVTLNCFNSLF